MRKYFLYFNFAVIFLCSATAYSTTNLVLVFITGIGIGGNMVLALYTSGLLRLERSINEIHSRQLAIFTRAMQGVVDETFTEDMRRELSAAMEAKYQEIQNRKES